jgi:hypothetical protein
LLVAECVKRANLVEWNRRHQALSWLRQNRPGYRLVQDGFLALGYQRLETACDEAGGFVDVRSPDAMECAAIRLLEELTAKTLPGFFGPEPSPPCRVIDRESATWNGMAVCHHRSEPLLTIHGQRATYRLPYIALKRTVFRPQGFSRAWSTYLHELAHCFGGDQSASFSRALTHILETAIANGQDIRRGEEEWTKLFSGA